MSGLVVGLSINIALLEIRVIKLEKPTTSTQLQK
jgi:hypothetical protein